VGEGRVVRGGMSLLLRPMGRRREAVEAYAPGVASVGPDTSETLALVSERTSRIIAHRRGPSIAKRRGWLVRRALLVADLAGIAIAMTVVAAWGTWSPWYGLYPLLGTMFGKLYGLYDGDEDRAHHTTVADLLDVFHVFTISAFLVLAAAAAWGTAPRIGDVVFLWAVTIPVVTVNRIVARALVHRSLAYLQNAIIVGAGDIGQLVARKIAQHPEYGINVVGFVDANPKAPREDVGDLTILGAAEDLPRLVHDLDVDRVIIAFSGDRAERTVALVRELRDRSMQIDIVPRLFEAVGPNAEIHAIEGLPLMGLPSVRITRTSRWLKRLLDLVVASTLLLFTLPTFLLIALGVKRSSPGPVLFRQRRLGMDRKPFTMLKFRTMYQGTSEAAHRAYIERTMSASSTATEAGGMFKLNRSSEITPFGAWLRKASLDELPQLINVIRGDMSLVGPRPCLEYETEFLESHHFERFLVPQGITGLWQVEGRALMTPKEALDLDVAYARAWSLRLDLSLLLRTIAQLFVWDRAR
jgi:exopolysaccharide biosynthesis polyprenyl glycosylphosphotransferase